MGASILDALANYNPSGFALRNQGLAAQNAQTQAQTGLTQQATQGEQLKNKMLQVQLRDQQILSDAFRQTGGDPQKTFMTAIQNGMSPMGAMEFRGQHVKLQQAVQSLTKEQQENEARTNTMVGQKLAALLPLTAEQRAQAAPGILSDIQQLDPTHAISPQALLDDNGLKTEIAKRGYMGTVLEQAQKQADTANKQADTNLKVAGLPGAQAESNLKQQGLLEKQRQDAATQLAAAKDQASYEAARNELPLKIATLFPQKYDRDAILKLGMTPEQVAQNEGQAQTRAETARHNTVEEGQGAARVGIERGKLAVEQQRFGWEAGGGVSPQAKMAAEGKLAPQTLRMMIRSNPGLVAQIRQVDPQFDEANMDKRYGVLNEFNSTSNTKAGGQAVALNTLIHHADLYMQAADAMKNGSFRPGNAVYNAVASAFGSAPPTNAALVARFFAGETSKVSTGGVPAEGEINGVLKNLGTSNSPEQIAQAGKTLLQIAAGRATPLIEKVKDAKLDKVVNVIGPDAKAILARRGFDPETLKPVGQTGAALPQGAGKVIDKATAQQFYEAAGRDPDKARKMATDSGWKVQ